MPPALTITRPGLARRRAAAAAGGVLLLAAVAVAAIPAESPQGETLAQALAPATWAMALPPEWLTGALAGVRPGDHVDVLAIRSGDRGYALPIAFGLRVMAVGGGGLVLELDEQDAIALATARGGGLLLVPILRSTR